MIKKQMKTCLLGALIFLGFASYAQTISTFDNVSLDTNGYWIGDSIGDGFVDEPVTFITDYDTSWGGYWAGGFAVSNHTDTVTPGYTGWTPTNPYSTYAGSAYSNDQFSIVHAGTYANARLKLDSSDIVSGFYITNSTYAAISMKYGDSFGKVFGADTLPNGADTNYMGQPVTGADWLKLTITPFLGDSLYANKAIDYFLADYRFADNSLDYIVKEWRWVDLTSMGEVDSLQFLLTSSDVGANGMNTPSFFCMDDFTTGEIVQSIENNTLENLISVFPNPSIDRVFFKIPAANFTIRVYDNVGKEVALTNESSLDISNLNSGVYIAAIEMQEQVFIRKIIKN